MGLASVKIQGHNGVMEVSLRKSSVNWVGEYQCIKEVRWDPFTSSPEATEC